MNEAGGNPVEQAGFVVDLGRRTITLNPGRPTEATLDLPNGVFAFNTNIRKIALLPGARRVVLTLPENVEAVVELGASREVGEDLQRGRPIVYLDQNHWSTISAWRQGDGRVATSETPAAQRLSELVQQQRILLPASAGHFVETTPLYGARRVALAGTVLDLSRGWQMRNPLHVRIEELRRGLLGEPPIADAVFGPAADELFASSREEPDVWHPGEDVPQDLGAINREIVGVLALYDAIVDDHAIPDQGGQAAAAAWSAEFATLAQQLRADGASRELRRRVSHARLITDMAPELMGLGHEIGLTAEEVATKLTTREDLVSAMPFVSRVRAVLFGRLSNATQRWEPNHLIDIMFLGCAAGYADLVIGERQTIGYLRQASGVPEGALVASTLREGLELLGL
jgi:hypothetical protein